MRRFGVHPVAGCGGRNKQLDIIYPITGNITSFDPQVAATQDEYLIAENCYEGLVRVEDDGTVKPAVAADWTVSTDQKDLHLPSAPGTEVAPDGRGNRAYGQELGSGHYRP